MNAFKHRELLSQKSVCCLTSKALQKSQQGYLEAKETIESLHAPLSIEGTYHRLKETIEEEEGIVSKLISDCNIMARKVCKFNHLFFVQYLFVIIICKLFRFKVIGVMIEVFNPFLFLLFNLYFDVFFYPLACLYACFL